MYIRMFSEQYNYGGLASRLTVYFTQLIRSQAIAN